MSAISQWLGSSDVLSDWLDADRAYDTARKIAARTSSVAVIRDGVKQDAQNVRIELLSSGMVANVFDREGYNLAVGQEAMLLIGYKSHPTITDTDLKRGDRFRYPDTASGDWYEVNFIINNIPDRLLAVAEAKE